MSDAAAPKSGDLSVTLATWLFILDQAGHAIAEDGLGDALEALRDAAPSEADHRGRQLAERIASELGPAPDFERVAAWVRAIVGASGLRTDFGDSREGRLRAIRAAQFRSSLPWIACIIDRFPDGQVGPHWVMVERVTDRVTCMDPYPWDDLDEEYELPVVEFMVKWELAGSNALARQG